MPRYVAFLRGASPLNAKMMDLRGAFEEAGFMEVKTVLSSGNVVFSADPIPANVLARRAKAAIDKRLGHTFYTIVRPASYLRDLVEADPYAAFDLPADAKRIVTFIGEPSTARFSLPIETSDGRILTIYGGDVVSAYVPSLGGSKVMTMIEKIFGTHVTTRTWKTVKKCAVA